MTEHKTFPGKAYAVSCAEDTTVVLPDPLGVKEAVVLECTAGQQLHVTATAGRLETSSDQAIVTELFKLAPRLRLTLLQGVAGGLLPRGFTELEYLESSGTQFIDTGIVTDGTYTINATLRGNNVGGSNDIWGRRGSDGASFAQRFARTYWLIAFYYVWGGQLSENQLNSAQIHDYIVTEGQKRIIIDGKSFNLNALNLSEVNASNPSSKTHYLFAANGGNRGQVCFYSFRMADGVGNVVLDFVPVLNKDGEPGMFDRVSKRFFENIGTGTFGYRIKRTGETVAPMSLRDPYYTAPSGVYARLIAENELDIIADTEEPQGDGWEWFANTGEAYENFGITQEEFLTE